MRTQERERTASERTHGHEAERESDSREVSCPECKDSRVIKSDGELVCEDCGLVVDDEQLDRGPDWRAFNSKERDEKSRAGMPTTQTMHDKGLSTQISWENRDGYGNQLSNRRRQQVERLRTWDERFRTRDSAERNLKFALGEIDRMASALGIPKETQEVAAVIYRRCLAEDMIRGRSIEGMATAAFYAACRQEGIARSLDEVEAVSRVEYQEIGRTYRYLARELGLEMSPVDPKDYIPRFASELGIGHEIQRKAEELLDAASDEGLISGRSPPGLAAAALYGASLILGEHHTQTEIADVAQVTTVTIRNRYQEQFEAVDLIMA